MTQKIFDTDNAEDMALLWSILPDDICKIEAGYGDVVLVYGNGFRFNIDDIFSINFHNKKEIERPIQEATEKDIYKLCCFWDSEYNPNAKIVGCLSAILPFGNVKYVARGGLNYKHCRRLTKQEIEELY